MCDGQRKDLLRALDGGRRVVLVEVMFVDSEDGRIKDRRRQLSWVGR